MTRRLPGGDRVHHHRRTALSTALTRRAPRAGAPPGPASTTEVAVCAPGADGPAQLSHVMNSAS